MRRTIVIIHPGALGDVLLAVTAMRRLRSLFPHNQLVLCATGHVARLLLECRVIDAWMSVEGRVCAELFGRSPAATGELQDWLGRCDLAVAWMQDDAGSLAAVLRRGGARDVRVRSPFSHELRAGHQSDRFVEAMGEPADESLPPVSLALPQHLQALGQVCLEERGVQVDQPLVLVHPGSGSRHKCAGPEVLVPVIEQLRESGALPLVLEGPADHDSVTSLLAHCSVRPIVLRGLELCALAGSLAHMRLFIGLDSGMTHLSALLGLQTIGLFGPTDPDRWAPRGPHVTVVRGAPCTCRSWNAVTQCIEKPCLQLSAKEIAAACQTPCLKDANPRNPSRSALSPPTPYAKVTS